MTLTSTEQMSSDMQEKIQGLMGQLGLGVLSTKDVSGHPYASLIAFAPSPDSTQLYFVTPKATRKFANIAQDPRVAMLINNCANEPSDFHQAMAVTVLGRVEVVAENRRDEVLPIYLEKHPYLQQFANSPSCALMAIHITGYTMVQQFQNVSELRLGS